MDGTRRCCAAGIGGVGLLVLLFRSCSAQIEGSELEWVNATQCEMGYFFNKTGCVCSKIRAQCPNNCNGHGVCDYATGVCACDSGWGSESDISEYKTMDCSLRTCPSAVSWAGLATTPTTARTVLECAGVGLCNKLTGECQCTAAFSGEACEFAACPNQCSGNGRCVNNQEVCAEPSVSPINTTDKIYGLQTSESTWDAARIFGCVCDSSWAVGTGSGELQVAEYHGADCSLRRCPSGDDPVTADVDETDCEGVNGGQAGNLCYVPCSNRGSCNEQEGVCKCNVGFAGLACNTLLGSTTRRQR